MANAVPSAPGQMNAQPVAAAAPNAAPIATDGCRVPPIAPDPSETEVATYFMTASASSRGGGLSEIEAGGREGATIAQDEREERAEHADRGEREGRTISSFHRWACAATSGR